MKNPETTSLLPELPPEGLRKTTKQGRICIELRALAVGKELCLVLGGGDRPHIGAAALAAQGESVEVVERPGHREAELVAVLAERASQQLRCPVAVVGGIHLDQITQDEITCVINLSHQLLDALLAELHAGRGTE